MELIDNLNKLCTNLLRNPKPLEEAGFSPEFITDLQNGYLFIPKATIVSAVDKTELSKKGVIINNCSCEKNKIKFAFKIKKFGIHAIAFSSIKLKEIVINSQEQKINIQTTLDDLTGDNIGGKLLLRFVLAKEKKKPFLVENVKKRISQNSLVKEVEINQNQAEITFDLSSMKQLRSLEKTIPLLNQTPLEILSVQGIEHVTGGIKIKANITLKQQSQNLE